MATTAPNNVPTNSAATASTFMNTNTNTTAGTINNQGVMLNRLAKTACKALTSAEFAPPVSSVEPKYQNNPNVIKILGTVVHNIYRIWVIKSVPAIAAAKLVVSESGDNLSPKYAPEIIAPAVIACGASSAVPIPISATPTVATVDQELPVATETIEQITTLAIKK